MSLPKKVHRLKLEKLIPGDIIASTSPSSLVSGLVRWYTQGPMSHVALYFDDNLIIEAVSGGVYVWSPYLIVMEDIGNVRVMRPIPSVIDFLSDLEKRQKLRDVVMSTWLGRYSLPKLLGFVVPPIRLIARSDEYICSELVARIYLACGLELCGGLTPEKTSPNDICSSKSVSDITAAVFEQVASADLEIVYGPTLQTERQVPKSSVKKPYKIIQDALRQNTNRHRRRGESASAESPTLKEARKQAGDLDITYTVLAETVARSLTQRSSRLKKYQEALESGKIHIREEILTQLNIALKTRRFWNVAIRHVLAMDDQPRTILLPSISRNVALHNLWLQILTQDLVSVESMLKVNAPLLPDQMGAVNTELTTMKVEDVKERIQNWLLEEEFYIRENSDPLCIFNFTVADRSGESVTVLQPLNKRDQVRILAKLEFTVDQTSKINALSESRRNEFIWNLWSAMLHIGVAYTGLNLPLQIVVIETPIYLDALTKDRFLEKEFLIRSALLLLVLMIIREIGEAPKVVGFTLM